MRRSLPLILALLLAAAGCRTTTPAPPSPADPAASIKTFQQTAGLPDLPVQFSGMTPMANSPSGNLQVGLYKDSDGRAFSVDTASGLIVEFDARDVPKGSHAALSEFELRTRAEALAKAATPHFAKVSAGLTYSHESKDDIYFFDWRTTTPSQDFMPPFIQVALRTNGDLVGYTNTVILPEN